MATDRTLSEQDIDDVSRSVRETEETGETSKRPQPYDFRRPDRIAKDQLRSISLLHESFARTLAGSLSAYLRAYVIVNVVSVEQLSFMEFSQCLPSPSCLVSLGMKPYEHNAVLEINPALVFPILEMLLGGNSRAALKVNREITEIERSILDGLYRIVLNDLGTAWQAVTALNFEIVAHETEPQLLQILAPTEAVVAVSLEVRIGESSGMMNLGIPSIVVKMLRHRFDQQWTTRRSESTEKEQFRLLDLIKGAEVHLDSRLNGPTLTVENLIDLSAGDVLSFDYPTNRSIDLAVNGKLKFRGHMVTVGRKLAFEVDRLRTGSDE